MNFNRLLLLLCGGILLMAAVARFLVASGNAPVLNLPDPALGLPLRYTVLGVGAIELLVALVCMLGRNARHQFAWLAWLSTDYLVFRICLLSMHVHPQNTCIGTLTDPLQLSRGTTGLIISLIPICLLAYSYSAVIYFWCHPSADSSIHQSTNPSIQSGYSTTPPLQSPASASLRMSCPACGIHIQFAAQNLGAVIPCPHCQAIITLLDFPSSTNPPIQSSTPSLQHSNTPLLRSTCLLCNGHIEFPAYGLGRTISCPHCHAPLTLKATC